MTLGAAVKARLRASSIADQRAEAPPGRTGSRQYKDKSAKTSNVRFGSGPRAGSGRANAPRSAEESRRRRERSKRVVGTHSQLSQAERDRLPGSVRKCFNGTGRVHYALYTWDPTKPEKKRRAPFTCASWRCPGECARHEAAVTFRRITDAMGRPGYDASGWVMCVLTIDREGYYTGEQWANADVAYKALGKMSGNFLRSLRRYCDVRGWRRISREWLAVVEAHRTGWPHVNVAVYAPELAAELEQEQQRAFAKLVCSAELLAGEPLSEPAKRLLHAESVRIGAELSELERTLVARRALGERLAPHDWHSAKLAGDTLGGKLVRFAVRAGWGVRSTVERVRDRTALAGYVTKLSGEGAQAGGELAKITQAPRVAPQRFRRLRSGVGFLPPRHKGGHTGTLVKRVHDAHGVRAEPVHTTPLRMLQDVAACCYHEEGLAVNEAAARRERWENRAKYLELELAAALQGRELTSEERGLPPLVTIFYDATAGPPAATGPPVEGPST